MILLLLLLSAFFIVWRYDIRVYHSIKEVFFVTGIFFLVGVLWDSFAIFRGHWNFNEDFLVGIKIGLMPLEEYLFMLVVPFWIIVVYKFINNKIKK